MKRTFRIITLIIILIGNIFLLGNRPFPHTQPVLKVNENMQIPVLMFHHLDNDFPSEFNGTIVTPKEFEETLKIIQDNGYNTVSLKQLADIYDKKVSPVEKPILITLDDGYASNYQYAFPLLKKYHMNAVIFVVTDSVGKKPGLFEHFTWEEAREMENSGLIEIQNHTTLHKTADVSTDEEFIDSVLSAQKAIDEHLGERKIKAFSYPQGKYNETLIKRIKEEGFRFQFTVEKGNNSLTDQIEKLKRYNVPHNHGGKDIISMINKYN